MLRVSLVTNIFIHIIHKTFFILKTNVDYLVLQVFFDGKVSGSPDVGAGTTSYDGSKEVSEILLALDDYFIILSKPHKRGSRFFEVLLRDYIGCIGQDKEGNRTAGDRRRWAH